MALAARRLQMKSNRLPLSPFISRELFEQDLCHHALVLMAQQMTVEHRHASYDGVGKVHDEIN